MYLHFIHVLLRVFTDRSIQYFVSEKSSSFPIVSDVFIIGGKFKVIELHRNSVRQMAPMTCLESSEFY